MPHLERITLAGLTVALAAQYFTCTRHFSLSVTLAVTLLGLALSALIPRHMRLSAMFRLVLILLITPLSLYRLTLFTFNPVADLLDLTLTVILLRCLLDDLWPHLKRRLQEGLSSIRRTFASPVMPPA